MYDRTYNNPGTGATGEADLATVSGFRLDKYEVTVGRFRQYVSYLTGSGGAPPVDGSGKHAYLNGGSGLTNSGSGGGFEGGWDAADWNTNIPTGPSAVSTWNANLGGLYATWPGGNDNRPINYMGWYAAYAFCIWDGGFLPSETEWEYAAAGGSQQREYPWGSTAPGTGSQYAIYGCYYNGTGNCTGVTNIAPVGTATLGVGVWGQLDLAGNLAEWNLDYSAAAPVPYVDPCTDCANLATNTFRIIRGGEYLSDTQTTTHLILAATRFNDFPNTTNIGGIRCARAP
jgi:formylglycine-generating enzyme required for sulfatase activity